MGKARNTNLTLPHYEPGFFNDTKGLKDSCIFALNVKATQQLYEMVMKQQEEIDLLKKEISRLNI